MTFDEFFEKFKAIYPNDEFKTEKTAWGYFIYGETDEALVDHGDGQWTWYNDTCPSWDDDDADFDPAKATENQYTLKETGTLEELLAKLAE